MFCFTERHVLLEVMFYLRVSGTDILTDLKTLPASGSLKNTAQVRVGRLTPVSKGQGLIDKKRLGNKEMERNKETEKNKETENKEVSVGQGLINAKSL